MDNCIIIAGIVQSLTLIVPSILVFHASYVQFEPGTGVVSISKVTAGRRPTLKLP